ncbi:MAG: rhodanese-like domain-containing protein [Gammaproteobacteria bacterium]|nr:rhodanese-like domain-containing protein [Gammaproteobacteria bacterium]MCK5092126.1 rhodanese-like domain-containing protein [Gammaproteobacteria bacterium]
MKKFMEIVEESLKNVKELLPWDLEEKLKEEEQPLLLDIREPYEYNAMHIKGSISVPRGILETACEYNYEETIPELVESRNREIVVICRSGYRSVLGAEVMQQLGYQNVCSLKSGLRGWNDYEQPLVNEHNEVVDIEEGDDYFTPMLKPEQIKQ